MLECGRVIGAPVTAGTLDEVADAVMRAAREGRGGYVCVADAHMVTTARRDPELLAIMEGALAVASDGMPLVWELRRQAHRAERVAGPDLTLGLCERAAAEAMPVFLYGSAPATMNALVTALCKRFPTLVVAGYETPPMLPRRPPIDPEVGARIEASGARLVLVGLGCPKQDFWMAAHAPRLSAALVGVGAAFEFHAGITPRAPRWMQRRGLEWLFRLACEPRRLWKRYLVTVPLFLWYLALGRPTRAEG
ncbi:MAG: WecB/TagA/CpsF family glycosyltransferase [Alphaproteobacteria bacterium]